MGNKKALVTGATKGIGKSIALKLAEDGFDIAINYRDDKKAEELEKILLEKNIEVLKVKGDISKEEDCIKIFNVIKEKWNKLDVLVNNAGIRKDNLILRMSLEDFKDVIDVNLTGTFLCMKYATKLMLKNKYGRIISISSVVASHGNVGQVNYSASKAGVIAMTKSLSKEVARKNITVNTISPGFINTDMTDSLEENIKENMLSEIPVKRFGEAEDISNIVSFLAREESSYITGQDIVVDGGLFT